MLWWRPHSSQSVIHDSGSAPVWPSHQIASCKASERHIYKQAVRAQLSSGKLALGHASKPPIHSVIGFSGYVFCQESCLLSYRSRAKPLEYQAVGIIRKFKHFAREPSLCFVKGAARRSCLPRLP